MNLEKLYQELKTLGRPVAYDHFSKRTPLPFLIYVDQGKSTFIADGKVWTNKRKIRLEVYSKNKDIDLEDRIESLLDRLEILWEDEPTYYIDDEKTYQHNYYFSI